MGLKRVLRFEDGLREGEERVGDRIGGGGRMWEWAAV